MSAYKVRLVAKHIARQLEVHRDKIWRSRASAGRGPPLFVGLQGPQGSGKTTLSSRLSAHLAKRENGGLKLAVLSMDDLYLPYEGLKRVASLNPSNSLLEGRGQPGTHDLALGAILFSRLKAINEQPPFAADAAKASDGHAKTVSTVHLPIFDKSTHGGYGDRSKETVRVDAPLDVVLFEGWSLGFAPIGTGEIRRRWRAARVRAGWSLDEESSEPVSTLGSSSFQTAFKSSLASPPRPPFFAHHSLSSLLTLDTSLSSYAQSWYPYLDAFVQIKHSRLEDVFNWRLEAERCMKERNGAGMTDEQVFAFVARYMPGYELFSSGVDDEGARWRGRGLRIEIDEGRNVRSVEGF